jgi:ADP-heptose:LPS heptosyltransferase
LFKTEIDTIPAQVPYLRADPARAAHWKKRLGTLAPAGYRRIGVVWAGRPEHGNDRKRSMALKQLAPLAALDRVVLVSLQKGPAGGQIGGYFGPAPLINLAPEIGDFVDTAAIIDALDLVVTVDTSVAHLAGAMAKPVCVLLPFAPDWRWLRNRHDSPWYPSVRLFRQNRPGDWSDAVARLAEFIDKH